MEPFQDWVIIEKFERICTVNWLQAQMNMDI